MLLAGLQWHIQTRTREIEKFPTLPCLTTVKDEISIIIKYLPLTLLINGIESVILIFKRRASFFTALHRIVKNIGKTLTL
jgi:hypothetical protein